MLGRPYPPPEAFAYATLRIHTVLKKQIRIRYIFLPNLSPPLVKGGFVS
jgi:hypothetical protein